MRQQLLAGIRIQIHPHLWKQNRRISNQKRDSGDEKKTQRCLPARLASYALAHAVVVVVEHIQPEIMRKIFRRHHQAKANAARVSQTTDALAQAAVSLLRANKKIKREEHKEDHQRVFLTDAIESNCGDTK